ncbi:unnamed protein product [Symbiodinium natans]|uniref:Uncharacterized protein n=1 Tax=Symbiodinium natans TaxID=878477 RepID=A0A812PC85_9DINO|nr:unnamed protein product [Symbiodinium natans]
MNERLQRLQLALFLEATEWLQFAIPESYIRMASLSGLPLARKSLSTNVFSKLEEMKWPNPDWLARRILKIVDEREAEYEARQPQHSRDMSPPPSTSSSFGRSHLIKATSETDLSTAVPSEAPGTTCESEAWAPRFGGSEVSEVRADPPRQASGAPASPEPVKDSISRDQEPEPSKGEEVAPAVPMKPMEPAKMEDHDEQVSGGAVLTRMPSRQNDSEYGDDFEEEPEEEEEVARPAIVVVAAPPPQPAKDSPGTVQASEAVPAWAQQAKAKTMPNNNNLAGREEVKEPAKGDKDLAQATSPAQAPEEGSEVESNYDDEQDAFEQESSEPTPAPVASSPLRSAASYDDEEFEEQLSEELGADPPKGPAGQQQPEAVSGASSPAEEQISEELEDVAEPRTVPRDGSVASPAKVVDAGSEVASNYDDEPEAFEQASSEPTPAGMAPSVAATESYDDEDFKEQVSEELAADPPKGQSGQPGREAASPAEAAEVTPAPMAPSEEAADSYADEDFEEQPSEELAADPPKGQSGQQGREAVGVASSPAQTPKETASEVTPAPMAPSAEGAESYADEDFEEQPSEELAADPPKGQSGLQGREAVGGAAAPAEAASEVSPAPMAPSVEEAESYADADFEEQPSEELPADPPKEPSGPQGREAVGGAASPAEAPSEVTPAPMVPSEEAAESYADEDFEEQASEELVADPPKEPSGQQGREAPALPAEAERTLKEAASAVTPAPMAPSVEEAESYADEDFEEQPSEELAADPPKEQSGQQGRKAAAPPAEAERTLKEAASAVTPAPMARSVEEAESYADEDFEARRA